MSTIKDIIEARSAHYHELYREAKRGERGPAHARSSPALSAAGISMEYADGAIDALEEVLTEIKKLPAPSPLCRRCISD